mmetsp:Transcript_143172/g.252699  ORF Transcript_143172/g.252699 Transcript_143172/m.252699 type:complete len:120 (+) Transcript_143172:85-444(+)
MTLQLKVTSALSGDKLGELDVAPDVTVLQLKELIEKQVGVPWHDQRLLAEGCELRRRGDAIGDVLNLENPEVALVVRQYERKEMQAAWLIEAIWKRNRRNYQENAAASRIAAFWRQRRN